MSLGIQLGPKTLTDVNNRIIWAGEIPVNSMIPNVIEVKTLPDGIYDDYIYENGEYIYSPYILPTPIDIHQLEAQITYTAMITDTLLSTMEV